MNSASWDDPDARVWLTKYISSYGSTSLMRHIWFWRHVYTRKLISGSHDSPSMGLAFAHDYAIAFGAKELQKVVDSTAIKFYLKNGYKSLSAEPLGYDFMSGGLLVTDIMRKVLSPKKIKKMVKNLCS